MEDFTYACGHSTGSVVTVLTLLGKVSGKHVRVDMTGGTLYVDAERNAAGRVTDLYLTGPTNVVCKGEITDENLGPVKKSRPPWGRLFSCISPPQTGADARRAGPWGYTPHGW